MASVEHRTRLGSVKLKAESTKEFYGFPEKMRESRLFLRSTRWLEILQRSL